MSRWRCRSDVARTTQGRAKISSMPKSSTVGGRRLSGGHSSSVFVRPSAGPHLVVSPMRTHTFRYQILDNRFSFVFSRVFGYFHLSFHHRHLSDSVTRLAIRHSISTLGYTATFLPPTCVCVYKAKLLSVCSTPSLITSLWYFLLPHLLPRRFPCRDCNQLQQPFWSFKVTLKSILSNRFRSAVDFRSTFVFKDTPDLFFLCVTIGYFLFSLSLSLSLSLCQFLLPLFFGQLIVFCSAARYKRKCLVKSGSWTARPMAANALLDLPIEFVRKSLTLFITCVWSVPYAN